MATFSIYLDPYAAPMIVEASSLYEAMVNENIGQRPVSALRNGQKMTGAGIDSSFRRYCQAMSGVSKL